ncbi:glycosyltransferase family 2 protein [Bacteroidales bacterium OttesenSCG-928-A17]|nr:glycosyltransferase family 2 protein [Bacteroidales bacterium OttesenSCG-928-A17]
MKQTGVVILNWNGKKLLEQFLPVLLRCTPTEKADVIVADNASSDDSLAFLSEHYPGVKTIVLDKNYGFAEGYNRAFSGLEYEYVVLLNSDVEVTPDWLSLAVDYLDEHPEISALQPKLLDYKDKSKFEYAGACGGYMDYLGYPFCRGRVFDTLETDKGQYDNPQEILWGSGACLFMRLKDYEEAGGLDAEFFAHQEEIDLCWRLNARGKKIVSFPQSVVYHVGGATLAMEHPRKTYLNFRNNLLLLYKNLPEKYYKKVMSYRFFLDYLAALRFLLKGGGKNAYSIWKARRDFRRMKTDYKEIRKQNLLLSVVELPPGIMKKSLLWQYYIGKKRKFSKLK